MQAQKVGPEQSKGVWHSSTADYKHYNSQDHPFDYQGLLKARLRVILIQLNVKIEVDWDLVPS